MIATSATAADAALTAREAEILHFIAHGLTSKQIARELNISPYTVNTHRDNLRRKLGVHNGAQLAYCQAARSSSAAPASHMTTS
ncbi:MAG: response regulator transcription factor [Hydrogenophaga sp.]|uniref:response regulator transcription factor n=1 Tax=Hydrogenophaga sp. TaxID=1904254 RepID=UPI0040351110